jgi:autophagy-related protein 9
MWEKLSNSSLLFSKTYHKQNTDFYFNTPFIHRLYNYYSSKGYYNIIYSQIVNIFISNFIIFFILFLANCVDFVGILNVNSISYIGNYVNMSNLFNLNVFVWILLVFFYIFTFMKVISVLDDIYVYKTIRNFYKKTLNISDKELDYVEWNTVVDKINKKTNQNLDIFYINSIITSKDNYFISLLDNNVINLNYLNKLMEWNLYFCIFFTIYNNDFKLNDSIFTEKEMFTKKVKSKMRYFSIFNFVFMPFILTLVGFYYLFNYGEIFYNKPQMIVSKGYSRKRKWELRYYNELEHEFNKRIKKAEELTTEYNSLFKFKILSVVSRLLVFLFSSIFIVFLIVSLINDKILVNLMVFSDKPVLWSLGILAPLIADLRSLTVHTIKRKPVYVLEELSNHVYIDEKLFDESSNQKTYKIITKNFMYKMILFIKDIFSIISTPFELWNISYKTDYILDYIIKNTNSHSKILFLCSYSNFENDHESEMFLQNSSKIILSKEEFLKNYTFWTPEEQQSIRINVV